MTLKIKWEDYTYHDDCVDYHVLLCGVVFYQKFKSMFRTIMDAIQKKWYQWSERVVQYTYRCTSMYGVGIPRCTTRLQMQDRKWHFVKTSFINLATKWQPCLCLDPAWCGVYVLYRCTVVLNISHVLYLWYFSKMHTLYIHITCVFYILVHACIIHNTQHM